MFEFQPWHFAAMEEAGYMDTSISLVNRVARYLAEHGSDEIDDEEFINACYACDVDPYSFDSDDFAQLQRMLNRLT